jgi:Fur family ferric uptake transcriptional regulator
LETKVHRKSHQREVILEELRRVKFHPTAAALYNVVRKRIPTISIGTIYRNLDLLSRNGIIQKLEVAGTKARFDGDIDKHYHIRCSQCGKIDDLRDFSLNKMSKNTKKLNGYLILGHHFEFVGICPDCQEKKRTKSKPIIH